MLTEWQWAGEQNSSQEDRKRLNRPPGSQESRTTQKKLPLWPRPRTGMSPERQECSPSPPSLLPVLSLSKSKMWGDPQCVFLQRNSTLSLYPSLNTFMSPIYKERRAIPFKEGTPRQEKSMIWFLGKWWSMKPGMVSLSGQQLHWQNLCDGTILEL